MEIKKNLQKFFIQFPCGLRFTTDERIKDKKSFNQWRRVSKDTEYSKLPKEDQREILLKYSFISYPKG